MQLRNHVEWALHCCAILSGLPAGRYLSTKALAEFHGVPKEYLSKALQELSKAGIVEATLGPSGGYRLARQASEVSFLDIVEAVEGRRQTFLCTEIRKNNPCRPSGHCDSHPCAIARIMREADSAWRMKLKETSLSDLIQSLEIEVPPEIWQASRQWVSERS